MLFSATSTKKTEDLIKLALKKEPMYVGIDDKVTETAATVSGLEQGYVICPSEKRLLLLFTFLKKNKKKQLMIDELSRRGYDSDPVKAWKKSQVNSSPSFNPYLFNIFFFLKLTLDEVKASLINLVIYIL